MHTIACQLESLFYAGSGEGTNEIPMGPTNKDESFADPVIQRLFSPPPDLTHEHIEKARYPH